jgi:hypothetical protein
MNTLSAKKVATFFFLRPVKISKRHEIVNSKSPKIFTMPNLVFYSTFVRIYLEYLDKKKNIQIYFASLSLYIMHLCVNIKQLQFWFFFFYVGHFLSNSALDIF